jgi:hypothetical protein
MDEFDPLQKVELAMIRAEHQKRYQVMINFIKEQVGEGIEYKNAVVRVVVSPNGAYYELNDLPEEFCGAAGDELEHHFVSQKEAIALLNKATQATVQVNKDNTRQFQIIALYTRKGLVDRKNCYVYDFSPTLERPQRVPLVIGAFQPDIMPLFFKVKMDAEFAQEVMGFSRSIVFCMANAGDRHLLVRILYGGDQVTDLGNLPFSQTIQ